MWRDINPSAFLDGIPGSAFNLTFDLYFVMNWYGRKHLRTKKGFVLQKDVSNKPQLIWKSLFWQSTSDLSLKKKKKDVIKFTSERPVHGLVMGE